MPNMPALIGQGMTALLKNAHVSAEQQHNVAMLFGAVGQTLWIEQEQWMDIITALSGSGPAYFYALMENLIKGATQLGLPEAIARELTIATAMGSAYMVESSSEPLATLRAAVTSKGGTTEQALGIRWWTVGDPDSTSPSDSNATLSYPE